MATRLSLWKAVDGGRSFRKIERLLEFNGIPCAKGEKSQWEGRYEIWVRNEDADRARALLFAATDGIVFQALDDIRDGTR